MVRKEGIYGINELGHREYVGGMWDEIGDLQFEFMVSKGLKPEHVLLDIACGSLRGGVNFIKYLNAGNYLGIDKEQKLIQLGKEIELGYEIESRKFPEFLVNQYFQFYEFTKIPDFSIAQSLFSHLNYTDINDCLQSLRLFVYDKPHKLYATFFENSASYSEHSESFSHSHRLFFYSREDIHRLGTEAGWNVNYIGVWSHPRCQVMIEFSNR